jgi:DNA-binding protein HU-beta
MAIKTLDEIKAALREKGVANLPGIGKLKVIDKAARAGRNPSTGAVVQIPARKGVKFSLSSVLADELNGK